ncbi:MAG: MFS transporter [Phycisphaerales bacterium]
MTAPGHPVSRPSPVWACLAFTFINSVATGVTFNGIPFINKELFKYELGASSALGVMLGVTYIFGAMFTGPFVRWAERTFPWCTPRMVLVLMMLASAVLNAVPTVTWFFLPPESRLHGTQIALWIFVALYSVICGGLWPVVESYVSGGRGNTLPRVIGKFNVLWSSALVGSMWLVPAVPGAITAIAHAMGRDIDRPSAMVSIFAVMGGVHLIALALLLWHNPHPGSHDETAHPTPASYAPLLRLHRALMPASYLVCYALSPFLPTMCDSLKLDERWQSIFASIWLGARPITFFVMDRWAGWHGTKFTATVGSGCVLSGFAGCVLSAFLPTSAGVAVAAVALAVFGSGMAMIYVAALYYAMEVGAAAVDEGGKHETLIGVGYTVGPLCGLGGAAAVAAGLVASPNPVMLGLVTIASLGGGAFLLNRSRNNNAA